MKLFLYHLYLYLLTMHLYFIDSGLNSPYGLLYSFIIVNVGGLLGYIISYILGDNYETIYFVIGGIIILPLTINLLMFFNYINKDCEWLYYEIIRNFNLYEYNRTYENRNTLLKLLKLTEYYELTYMRTRLALYLVDNQYFYCTKLWLDDPKSNIDVFKNYSFYFNLRPIDVAENSWNKKDFKIFGIF